MENNFKISFGDFWEKNLPSPVLKTWPFRYFIFYLRVLQEIKKEEEEEALLCEVPKMVDSIDE